MSKSIPDAALRRLPRYYRLLSQLQSQGVERISSSDLASLLGQTASQVRQDFHCLGNIGRQGVGYRVESLREQIAKLLGMQEACRVVIAGAGNIGRAVAGYSGLAREGFNVLALFDVNEEMQRSSVGNLQVLPMEKMASFMREHHVTIGVIAVPKNVGQEVADLMVAAGVKGIWNFAPTEIRVPAHIVVEDVRLLDSLMVLSARMRGGAGKK